MTSQAEYRLLAALRYEIRKFLAFSEQVARDAGVEPQQHQMLLAIRGLPDDLRPSMPTIAERLCVDEKTAIALANRLVEQGLLRRDRSDDDTREVLLRLTPEGDAILRELSKVHRRELRRSAPAMVLALAAILRDLF